jgi:hypothetical protein
MNIEAHTPTTVPPFTDKKLYELEELLHLVTTDSYFSLLRQTLEGYAPVVLRGAGEE